MHSIVFHSSTINPFIAPLLFHTSFALLRRLLTYCQFFLRCLFFSLLSCGPWLFCYLSFVHLSSIRGRFFASLIISPYGCSSLSIALWLSSLSHPSAVLVGLLCSFWLRLFLSSLWRFTFRPLLLRPPLTSFTVHYPLLMLRFPVTPPSRLPVVCILAWFGVWLLSCHITSAYLFRLRFLLGDFSFLSLSS